MHSKSNQSSGAAQESLKKEGPMEKCLASTERGKFMCQTMIVKSFPA